MKNNNELKRHKAADTIKWIVAFVLIIAIMGAVICLALQVGGVYDFFKKKDDTLAEDTPIEDQMKPEDLFVLNPVSTQYVKLLASAAQSLPYDSDMQVHLTATIEPENAEDKRLDWSVAFANPVSEWATGKTVTDYVTVTPTADGSLEADVKGLKAFGEQIIITCTSRANSAATATCTVDYIARYALTKSVTASGDGSADGTVTIKLTKSDSTLDAKNTLSYSFGYEATAFAKYQEIFKKQGFTETELQKQSLSSASDSAVSGLSHQIRLPFVKSNLNMYDNYTTEGKLTFYKKFFTTSAAQTIASTPEKQNKANVAIKEWLDYIAALGDSKSVFTLSLTLKSNNSEYSFSATDSFNVLIESAKNDGSYASTIAAIKSSIKDVVSDVELSQGGIVF